MNMHTVRASVLATVALAAAVSVSIAAAQPPGGRGGRGGAIAAGYPLSSGFATTFDYPARFRHMPFAVFKLHPDLLKGVRELGFTRATPTQEQAIPPALEGRDLLVSALT